MRQLAFILIAAATLAACQSNSNSAGDTSESETTVLQIAPENLVSMSFEVEGMTCTGCENTVERSLKTMAGVAEVDASHETGKALVQYDKTKVTEKEVADNIAARGYKVTGYTEAE